MLLSYKKNMLTTSARLLRLLLLLQSRRSWSGAELAQSLEVNVRTLRRDIDRLRQLGYPIEACSGVAGGYQLGTGASLPPLLLQEDEALAVLIALKTAHVGIQGIQEAAIRSFVKIQKLLPDKLKSKAEAITQSVVVDPWTRTWIESDVLIELVDACLLHLKVEFDYVKRQGEQGRRKVEPVGVVYTSGRWYLAAWDLSREDWRTFRVDRISSEVQLGDNFAARPLPENGNIRKYISRSLGVDCYKYKARIIYHASKAVMEKKISPNTGLFQEIDQNKCLFEVGIDSLDNLGLYLCSAGVDFEIDSPKELIEHCRTWSLRLQRACSDNSTGTKF